jgi:uncharacterized membrane protein YpjA
MLGLLWLVVNLVLDFVILLPMSHMSLSDYIAQIGLRYLMIPIFSTGFWHGMSKQAETKQ